MGDFVFWKNLEGSWWRVKFEIWEWRIYEFEEKGIYRREIRGKEKWVERRRRKEYRSKEGEKWWRSSKGEKFYYCEV